MHEQIYGRNAVYETLRAQRRRLFGLQIGDGVKPTGRIADIMELAAGQKVPATLVPRSRLISSAPTIEVALEVGEYPTATLSRSWSYLRPGESPSS
jgi:hypothetical protein